MLEQTEHFMKINGFLRHFKIKAISGVSLYRQVHDVLIAKNLVEKPEYTLTTKEELKHFVDDHQYIWGKFFVASKYSLNKKRKAKR